MAVIHLILIYLGISIILRTITLYGLTNGEQGVDYYFWLRTLAASTRNTSSIFLNLSFYFLLTLIGGGSIFAIIQAKMKTNHEYNDYREASLLSTHNNTIFQIKSQNNPNQTEIDE